jgi:hypothetical protein
MRNSLAGCTTVERKKIWNFEGLGVYRAEPFITIKRMNTIEVE